VRTSWLTNETGSRSRVVSGGARSQKKAESSIGVGEVFTFRISKATIQAGIVVGSSQNGDDFFRGRTAACVFMTSDT